MREDIDPLCEPRDAATRLTRLHPYPAMVADGLAIALADRYVNKGDYVCDPFCGSGRLLVASAATADLCVGIDVNPLAVLLTRAKFARLRPSSLQRLHSELLAARTSTTSSGLKLRGNRKVSWFSSRVASEIENIIEWINSRDLSENERLVVAAAASAAFRDASYISKRSWKLHRIQAKRRKLLRVSTWDCFARRLSYCATETRTTGALRAESLVLQSEAAAALSAIAKLNARGSFDVVITSPPYGDSDTTVQYGAASGILLDCVSRISGLEALFVPGHLVDNRCLGGLANSGLRTDSFDLRRYWAGSKSSSIASTVVHFLRDFAIACEAAAACLKQTGTLILIVGRRTTGGYRLKLDEFAADILQESGLSLVEKFTRRIESKRLPRTVNRFGNAASKSVLQRGLVLTMSEEIILVFRRT